MGTLLSQFFVSLQRTTKQPLARIAIIGILSKLALDSVSVIMPASLEWLLMPFIPLLGIGSLVMWVAAVRKDEECIDLELSDREQPLQLSNMISTIAFIMLIVLIVSNLAVSFLGTSSMTIVGMAVFDLLILAFFAVTGDVFRILRRLLVLRRSSSTKLTTRVTLLFVAAFLLFSTLHFVFGIVDAMAIVISCGGLAALWFFVRLNQNDWINSLQRKEKISLFKFLLAYIRKRRI